MTTLTNLSPAQRAYAQSAIDRPITERHIRDALARDPARVGTVGKRPEDGIDAMTPDQLVDHHAAVAHEISVTAARRAASNDYLALLEADVDDDTPATITHRIEILGADIDQCDVRLDWLAQRRGFLAAALAQQKAA